MKLIRTVPSTIPENRHYVIDSIDRVPIQNYDMHFLTEYDDDVILLEWDIAVGKHDIFNFIQHCLAAPNLVHVAPYPLYPESLDELVAPVWAHREMTNPMPLQLRWIDYGEPVCDIFSTGMIFLPRHIIRLMGQSDDLITWHHNINDSKLAFWYYHEYGIKVPVHWDVRPIHLHYDQEGFYSDGPCTRIGSSTRAIASGNRYTIG